jgi:GH24 family phage-related lysozyme (muramidase)
MFSPYAAMGNAPESMVDPNGTLATYSSDGARNDELSGNARDYTAFQGGGGTSAIGGRGGLNLGTGGGSDGKGGWDYGANKGAYASFWKAINKVVQSTKGNTIAYASVAANMNPKDGRRQGKGHADPLTNELETPNEKGANDDMHLSDDGYALLANYEAPKPGERGFQNGKYTIIDVGDGKMTIGLGYVVTTAAEAKEFANGITPEKAIALMRGKVSGFEETVKGLINAPLSQSEFDALVLFTYQSGTIYNDLTNAINRRQSLDVIKPIWLSHDISKGVHNRGVKNRRQDEFELFSSGDYHRDH